MTIGQTILAGGLGIFIGAIIGAIIVIIFNKFF